jgi:hypothetical protein
MSELWEQTAYIGTKSPAVQPRRQDTYRRPVRTDDALYETRMPNSTRRYAAPPKAAPQRTVMRVTHHDVPPRASLRQAPAQEERPTPARQQLAASRQRPRVHWLALVGVGMLAMLVLWQAVNAVYSWGIDQYNDLHYGYPRTFQCDANVGHGGESHFIVVNLHGHVFITEILASDPSKTKIYVGPVITGPGAEREPVTISFQDTGRNGRPAMLLKVGSTVYPWQNTGQAFRPAAQQTTISG